MDFKKSLHVGDKVRVLRNRALFEKEGPRWSRQVYEIEHDDITTFRLKGQNRVYKHYELLKIGSIEKNPYVRVAESHDVEQNLDHARRNRRGPTGPVDHRPQTRFREPARIGFPEKQSKRGPTAAQKEEIELLKRKLIGIQFVDDDIQWKIVNVKWHGTYKQIMVYYYNMNKYKEVPGLIDQEYTPIEVMRDILSENNL